MAYGEFYVERQCWARFPKVLIMCRKHGRMENGNCAVERRRYVPERTCQLTYKRGAMYDVGYYSCCGYELATPVSETMPAENYCPNCGAKVVVE